MHLYPTKKNRILFKLKVKVFMCFLHKLGVHKSTVGNKEAIDTELYPSKIESNFFFQILFDTWRKKLPATASKLLCSFRLRPLADPRRRRLTTSSVLSPFPLANPARLHASMAAALAPPSASQLISSPPLPGTGSAWRIQTASPLWSPSSSKAPLHSCLHIEPPLPKRLGGSVALAVRLCMCNFS